MLIALPETQGDIYRQHQLVWRVMHTHARSGRDFIYTMRGARMACVRSQRLPHGQPSRLREGPLEVRLVTAKRNGHRMQALNLADAASMAIQLLETHGIRADALAVLEQTTERGTKGGRDDGVTFPIALPVSRIRFDAHLTHPGKANQAWAYGIGRGKRFGFGMLMPGVSST